MTILFSTFGSLGDIHPYLAVAFEAKARGHRPIIATARKYQSKIEGLGLEFRAIRPDLPPESEFGAIAQRVMNLKDGPRYLFEEILNPNLRDSYSDLLAAGADADLIVTHPAVIAGPLVAQKLKKKWLCSVLAPLSLWSRFDPGTPPTLPQLDFLRILGPHYAALMFRFGQIATRKWITEWETLRREIGVPNLGHPMMQGQFSPFGTLALFSRHFARPQRDWPRNTLATGFCFYDAAGFQAPDALDFRAWISQGEAPIVFTLGSSAVHDAGDFWNQSETLVRGNEERAIFLTAGTWQSDSEQILALDYAPHSELFPLAKFVVHQGGAGTTAQALRAGVPQIVTPFAHDQPDNARRIEKLGVGFGCNLKRYLRGGAGQIMESMTDNYETFARPARELGEKIRAENGPRAACEMMERVFAATISH